MGEMERVGKSHAKGFGAEKNDQTETHRADRGIRKGERNVMP